MKFLPLALLLATACADPSDLDEGEDGADWYSAEVRCPLDPANAEDASPYYYVAYQFDARPYSLDLYYCSHEGELSDGSTDTGDPVLCVEDTAYLTEEMTLLVGNNGCGENASEVFDHYVIDWTYGT